MIEEALAAALGVTAVTALGVTAMNVAGNALMDTNDAIRSRNSNYRRPSRANVPRRVQNTKQYRRDVRNHNDKVLRDMIY